MDSWKDARSKLLEGRVRRAAGTWIFGTLTLGYALGMEWGVHAGGMTLGIGILVLAVCMWGDYKR